MKFLPVKFLQIRLGIDHTHIFWPFSPLTQGLALGIGPQCVLVFLCFIRQPKYIGNLLKFAEVRKKEEERRVERQVQNERENEGNEFADKDAFVTSAYPFLKLIFVSRNCF